MLYNIYYCPINDKCFGWPDGKKIEKRQNFMPEMLATYDSDTDCLEMDDEHFNWYDLKDNWDEEINRAIENIIDSPVIWYCLVHGDCHITDRFIVPLDPCFTSPSHTRDQNKWRSFCICEQIATCHLGEIVSNVGDLRKYFDDANDGYKMEYLENEMASYQMNALTI